MARKEHASVLTETIHARVVTLGVLLVVLGLGLFVLFCKLNAAKFHNSYEAVYVGQPVADVHKILEKKGLDIRSRSSEYLEASTIVGFSSDLVMTLELDESGRVAEKNAFDTGFNMFLF